MTKPPHRPGPAEKSRVYRPFKARSGGSGGDAGRTRDLAAIHCLKRDLKLDDEQYRAVLWTVARVDSSAQLDDAGRARLISHLRGRLPAAAKAYPKRPQNVQVKDRAELTKIEALLTDAGRPWAYAEAMLKHMSRGRKLRLEFANNGELAAIVAALHKDALKRLHTELAGIFGDGWEDYAAHYAGWLFGWDTLRQDVTRYPQALSPVLRWWRGELEAACRWPVTEHTRSTEICAGCDERHRRSMQR